MYTNSVTRRRHNQDTMTRWATHLTMPVDHYHHHHHYQYDQDCKLGRVENVLLSVFLEVLK